MCDRRAFHFRAIAVEHFDQAFFHIIRGNKLIAAHNASGADCQVGIDFFTGFHCQIYQSFICDKFPDSHLRKLSQRIPEYGSIHIMMNRIFGNQDIPNIQICIQGTCHTGVNHMGDLK